MSQIQGITNQQISSTPSPVSAVKLSGIEKVINAVKTFFKNGADGAVTGYNRGQIVGSRLAIIPVLYHRPFSFKNGVSQLASGLTTVVEIKGATKEMTAWCGAIIGAVIGAIRENGPKNDSASSVETEQNKTEEVDTAIPASIEPNLHPQNQQNGKVTTFIETYFKNAMTGASSGEWLGRKLGLLVGLAEVSSMVIKDIKVNQLLVINKLADLKLPRMPIWGIPIFIGSAKELYATLGMVGGAAIGSIAHAVRRPEEKEKDVVLKTSQPEKT